MFSDGSIFRLITVGSKIVHNLSTSLHVLEFTVKTMKHPDIVIV